MKKVFLAENIRFLRESLGLTQSELGVKLGFNNGKNIGSWEQCVSQPKISALVDMSEIFNQPIDALLKKDLGAVELGVVEEASLLYEVKPCPRCEELEKEILGLQAQVKILKELLQKP